MEYYEDKEKSQRNSRIIALMVIASLVVMGAFLAFARWKTVLANTPDINSARTLYPFIVGTRLDTCSLCHTSSIPNLNPYGAAYLAAGRIPSALTAIENLDSDGDGYSNITELKALTFPGDPNDHPVAATPTSLPPTATKVPPTATSVPPTATKVPPTATSVPPTATKVPPTATSMPPTNVPPTATSMPPTNVPPTATSIAPTSMPPTSVPPTATLPPVGQPGVTPTVKPTHQPRPTEAETETEVPHMKPTHQPRPTEVETETEVPHMRPTRTPRSTRVPGCWPNEDHNQGSQGGENDGMGNKPTPSVQCTPVSGDGGNRQPYTPRPRRRSGMSNFVAFASGSAAGYPDVPQW